MDRDVTSFIADVMDEKLEHKTIKTTLAKLVAHPDETMAAVYDYVEEQLNLGKLGYGEIQVSDTDVVIRLETNLINLPLQDIKRIDKMISDEDRLPVNVYIVMSSPYVNVSGLRIDEVASADDYLDHMAQYLPMMNDWVADHLAAVQENMKTQAEKEADEKKAKAKPKAKAKSKTTTKKAQAKTKTRKRTTKKVAEKK